MVAAILEAGPAAPHDPRSDRPTQDPSWTDSTEVVMLESRLAWWSSNFFSRPPGTPVPHTRGSLSERGEIYGTADPALLVLGPRARLGGPGCWCPRPLRPRRAQE